MCQNAGRAAYGDRVVAALRCTWNGEGHHLTATRRYVKWSSRRSCRAGGQPGEADRHRISKPVQACNRNRKVAIGSSGTRCNRCGGQMNAEVLRIRDRQGKVCRVRQGTRRTTYCQSVAARLHRRRNGYSHGLRAAGCRAEWSGRRGRGTGWQS